MTDVIVLQLSQQMQDAMFSVRFSNLLPLTQEWSSLSSPSDFPTAEESAGPCSTRSECFPLIDRDLHSVEIFSGPGHHVSLQDAASPGSVPPAVPAAAPAVPGTVQVRVLASHWSSSYITAISLVERFTVQCCYASFIMP